MRHTMERAAHGFFALAPRDSIFETIAAVPPVSNVMIRMSGRASLTVGAPLADNRASCIADSSEPPRRTGWGPAPRGAQRWRWRAPEEPNLVTFPRSSRINEARDH